MRIKEKTYFYILLIVTFFSSFCVWSDEAMLQTEIDHLRDLYTKIFNSDEVVFEGIKVQKDDALINRKEKEHVTFYYYFDPGTDRKVKHGLVRLYRDREIIMEGIYLKGRPSSYMFFNLPQETLKVIFKDGKPYTGTYPVILHNAELLGLEFKDGEPIKATIFDRNGVAKEIIFDVSKNEKKNGLPWDGEFLSMKDRKIKKYIDGKMVSSTDCENLAFIENILESFNKK